MKILIRRNPPTRRLAIERLENRSMLSVVVAPIDPAAQETEQISRDPCAAWVDLEALLASDAQDAADKCQESTELEAQEPLEEAVPTGEEKLADEFSESELSSSSDETFGRTGEWPAQGLAPEVYANRTEAPTNPSGELSPVDGVAVNPSDAKDASRRAAPVDLQRVFGDAVGARKIDPPTFATPTITEPASGLLSSSRRSSGAPSPGGALRPSLGMTRLMDGSTAKTFVSTGSQSFTSEQFTTRVLGTAASSQRVRAQFVTRTERPVVRTGVESATRAASPSRESPPTGAAAAKVPTPLLESGPLLPQPKLERPVSLRSLPRARIIVEVEADGSRQSM